MRRLDDEKKIVLAKNIFILQQKNIDIKNFLLIFVQKK